MDDANANEHDKDDDADASNRSSKSCIPFSLRWFTYGIRIAQGLEVVGVQGN